MQQSNSIIKGETLIVISELIQEFTNYCLKYPDMPIESVFNRYMQLLNAEQIAGLKPYFMLVIKTGEAARNAEPEIQKILLQTKI